MLGLLPVILVICTQTSTVQVVSVDDKLLLDSAY